MALDAAEEADGGPIEDLAPTAGRVLDATVGVFVLAPMGERAEGRTARAVNCFVGDFVGD